MSAADDVREAFEGKRGKILLVGGALAIVGYVAYTRWNGTPAAADPNEQTAVEGDATRVPQSQPPVGNDSQTGTVNARPTSNPDWVSQGTDVLVGRGAPAAAANSALSKALEGSQLTAQEMSWVSQVIAVLGSPPDGMPPINSAPPTGGGGGAGGKKPATPTGLRLAVNTPTRTMVSWVAVPTAKGYTIQFAGRTLTASGPNANFTGLRPGGGYGITVRAFNNYGTSGKASLTWHTPKK